METWQTCWCTWDEDNAFPHWRWVQEADYPPHEPSVEWNLPEPTDAELAEINARTWGFAGHATT